MADTPFIKALSSGGGRAILQVPYITADTLYTLPAGGGTFGGDMLSSIATGEAAITAAGDYVQMYGEYNSGSYATTYLYDDHLTPTYNQFSVTEIPTW